MFMPQWTGAKVIIHACGIDGIISVKKDLKHAL